MVHDSVKEDLRRLDGLTFSPNTNIRKFIVVITPDSIQPGIETLGTFLGGAEERKEWGEQMPEGRWRVFHDVRPVYNHPCPALRSLFFSRE